MRHERLVAGSSLTRARLLEGNLATAGVAFVVAPAGSGKTTLLAQYADSTDHPVAWFRADPAVEDADDLAVRLTQAVAEADGTVTLVVDDAHALAGTPAEAALEQLVVHRPPQVRLLLAARRMPAWEIPKAELGPVALVTPDDLRFRSWEVEALFRDVYGEPLPPVDCALLTRRTEGWAASLQLFHLSTAGRSLGERRRAVATLTRQARFVRGYLTRAVLDELPDDVRFFLRRTCVLEVLTARRCDELLGTTGAGGRLDDLERRQALTTSDDGGDAYRYHALLRRHLEGALHDELGPAATREWYRRAAGILEAEGAVAEALRAYARADAWSDVRRLLSTSGDRVAAEPAGAATPHDVLPPNVIDDDPWLSLAVARRQVRDGRVSEAVRRYRRCEQLLERRSDRERVARERRLVALWVGGEPRPELHWLDRLRLAMKRAPAPPEASTADDSLGAAITVLIRGGLPPEALLADLVGDARADRLPALGARLVSLTCAAARRNDVASAADRLADDAERHAAPWVARLARALTALQTGAPDPLAAQRVVDECAACGDEWGAAIAGGIDALRRLLHAEPAAGAWQRAAARLEDLDAPCLASWAHCFAALAAAVEHRPDAEDAVRRARRLPTTTTTHGARAVAALAQAVAEQRADAAARPSASREHAGDPAWLAPLAAQLAARSRPAQDGVPDLPGQAPPPTTVRCFGGFRLVVHGRAVDCEALRPQVASLLHLLAMYAGERVHREFLLAALWPRSTPAAAAHSLHVAVSALRRSLVQGAGVGAPPVVTRSGETYGLTLPPGSWVDVLVFDHALRTAAGARADGDVRRERAALGLALQAYAGDLLPDDGPAEWVVPRREELRLAASTAAGRAADLALADDDAAGAVTTARRACQIDPYRDASWRALITAYERCGDGAEAERARAEYDDVLVSLGVQAESSSRRARRRGERTLTPSGRRR